MIRPRWVRGRKGGGRKKFRILVGESWRAIARQPPRSARQRDLNEGGDDLGRLDLPSGRRRGTRKG
eukprot:5684827-Pleurochrysis_carterae.AAC.1